MEHFGFPVVAMLILVGVVALSIAIDFFGHKDGHTMGLKESAAWSVFWISLAGVFWLFLDSFYGSHWSSLFLSGYALEKALSVDNLMVFTAIFASFGIRCQATQHRILLWGIAGALVFRAIFVALGTELFNLHWSIQLVFAAIVAWSAKAMLSGDEEEEVDYTQHKVCKFVRRFRPVSDFLDGDKFTTVKDGVKYVTPVFLCMCVVELSDVMFSFDSVPAVIGVTQEPLLVYSAMIFAILGLRALYFVLTQLIKYLCHLEKAVAGLLIFVAAKLAFGAFGMHMDATISLYIVLATLGTGVLASLVFPEKE